MILSVVIALITVWAAIAASYLYTWPVGFFVGLLAALAYDSYYWGPSHQGLPVSFFIVTIIFAAYLAAGLPAAVAARRRVPAAPAAVAADEDRIAA